MTDIQAVRVLIGDQASTSYTDEEIGLFCTLASVSGPGAEYFFAASMALEGLAAKKGNNLQELRLGDFVDSSGKNQVASLQAAADAFKKLYYETPAFAWIENDNCDFNALTIIRNFVLRTTP